MNRKHSCIAAAITVASVTAAAAALGTPARAAPGEIGVGGMRLIASVDSTNSAPAGDISAGVPFSHATKVSGNFSVALDGAPQLQGGRIVAGYLVGCAVDVSEGVSIAIVPEIGGGASIAPYTELEVATTFEEGAAPVVTIAPLIGVEPSVGVESALAGEVGVNLAPGTVAPVVVGETELTPETTFPYAFAHAGTPLNVDGCLSPASAMPFVTVTAQTPGGTAQTTGYGTPFEF
ncbi:MspA family porin [Nocardia carnea]|uniref:MspA family porin n=1 Tax=Nocardia carnea TaxID=37328 RepID=UPI0024550477|nr:MspA family porin [Nocardia carnea]